MSSKDLAPGKMLRTWQFYALIVMFMGVNQAGLLIIANASGVTGVCTVSSFLFTSFEILFSP